MGFCTASLCKVGDNRLIIRYSSDFILKVRTNKLQSLKVFVSVGGTANAKQEVFVTAVEARLRAEGLVPHTVGRNTFSSDSPLKTVSQLLDECAGTIVIALERTYFPSGLERRDGPKQSSLDLTRFATPWNQIEAALSYDRGLPLMVLVEEGIRTEGLLERGYDWYVQSVTADPASLNTVEFNSVLAAWKKKLAETPKKANAEKAPAELTIGELVSGLKTAQLWSVLAAIASLAIGAFLLGGKVLGGQ
jgi:hypothetical protein